MFQFILDHNVPKKVGLFLEENGQKIQFANSYPEVDIILFDFLDQSSKVRISALKKVLPHLKVPFGLLVLQ